MILALGLLGQLISGTAFTDESGTSGTNHEQAALQRSSGQETVAAIQTAKPANVKPLWLPQTRSDWDAIVSDLQVSAVHSGKANDGRLEEVTVTAAAELLPMDDIYDEMWGGILAPVWAMLHPTQAWRIFLPVPPK